MRVSTETRWGIIGALLMFLASWIVHGCAVLAGDRALEVDPEKLARLADQIEQKIDAAEAFLATNPHPEISRYLEPARAAVGILRSGGDLAKAREAIAQLEPAFRTYLVLRGRTPAQIELEVMAISTALDVLEWCLPEKETTDVRDSER